MTQPSPLTREMLESVFPPGDLMTVPEGGGLDDVQDSDARKVLQDVGLPRTNVWIALDDVTKGLVTLAEAYDWELAETYSDVPLCAEQWFSLGALYGDGFALDPRTGKVYCLPEDAEIYESNSSLRRFVQFLHVMQVERPHFDLEWEGDAELDQEGARERVEAAMKAVDPGAFDNPGSHWFNALTSIVDPEWHFY